jgi:hypothetical protein
MPFMIEAFAGFGGECGQVLNMMDDASISWKSAFKVP